MVYFGKISGVLHTEVKVYYVVCDLIISFLIEEDVCVE